jgi:hypothetical protein
MDTEGELALAERTQRSPSGGRRAQRGSGVVGIVRVVRVVGGVGGVGVVGRLTNGRGIP